MEGKVILITQARIGSSRLPAKVLKEINGISLLEIHLSRVKNCKRVNQIVVATPLGQEQKPIHDICNKVDVQFYEGSESNVLDRYFLAGQKFNAEWVVRITSDCPLIDPILIDEIIEKVLNSNKDYGSNTLIETYPDGQDVEVFKFSVLEDSRKRVALNSDREHVTPFIKRNCENNSGILYSSVSLESDIDFSEIRMTVDEKEDFDAIKILIDRLGQNSSWFEYANYIINNMSEFPNQLIIRNEGYLRSLKKD